MLESDAVGFQSDLRFLSLMMLTLGLTARRRRAAGVSMLPRSVRRDAPPDRARRLGGLECFDDRHSAGKIRSEIQARPPQLIYGLIHDIEMRRRGS